MATPKKNVAYEFSMPLVDTANPTNFKVNPTIAAGDFQVSTDNAAFANLTTLPVVSPSGSIMVKVNLSAAEMNGDKVMVRAKDAAGAEWDEALVFIDVPISNQDNINTLEQLLRNKTITDPATGVMTVFDDNGSALFTANIFEDAGGTQAYRGQGAERKERFT